MANTQVSETWNPGSNPGKPMEQYAFAFAFVYCFYVWLPNVSAFTKNAYGRFVLLSFLSFLALRKMPVDSFCCNSVFIVVSAFAFTKKAYIRFLFTLYMVVTGIEPATIGLLDQCSTN